MCITSWWHPTMYKMQFMHKCRHIYYNHTDIKYLIIDVISTKIVYEWLVVQIIWNHNIKLSQKHLEFCL